MTSRGHYFFFVGRVVCLAGALRAGMGFQPGGSLIGVLEKREVCTGLLLVAFLAVDFLEARLGTFFTAGEEAVSAALAEGVRARL